MSVLVTRSCRALGVGITEGFFYLLTICRSFAGRHRLDIAVIKGLKIIIG